MKILFLLLFLSVSSPEDANSTQNLDFWISQLKSSSIDLQINALEKLPEINNPKATPDIIESLQSPNAEIRYYAAVALAKLPTHEGLAALADRLVVEKDVYVKSEINRSIRKLKDYFDQLEKQKQSESDGKKK